MHKVPSPHVQARLLQSELNARGHVLVYQAALEIVAHMMGYKNWKTMAALYEAQALAPVADVVATSTPAQSSVPGEASAPLYRVRVTTDASMSADINVRAESAEEAEELACEFAASNLQLFEVDEGNYRGLADFYVGDKEAIELVAPETDAPVSSFQSLFEALSVDDFDLEEADVENNMGMSGDYQVLSKDGTLMLTASLNPDEPDNSDDDARAVCTLEVKLTFAPKHPQAGTVIAEHRNEDYRFYGDDRSRGDHLEEMMDDDELLELLTVVPATAQKA